MPTYEYECTRCSHLFERFQRMSEKPVRVCEVCGGKVKRLISAGAGLIFKGSGFYITDYRSSSYKKKAEEEKSKTAKGGEKSSSQPSKKPAADPAANPAANPASSGRCTVETSNHVPER